jgi:hypothetical protein
MDDKHMYKEVFNCVKVGNDTKIYGDTEDCLKRYEQNFGIDDSKKYIRYLNQCETFFQISRYISLRTGQNIKIELERN